jgi:hypothetical protein
VMATGVFAVLMWMARGTSEHLEEAGYTG